MRIAGRLHAAVSIRPGRGLLAVGANPPTLLSRDQILLDAARPVLAYIARAGIGDDKEGPLFRPMKPDSTGLQRRHLDRKIPWRLANKYCCAAASTPTGWAAGASAFIRSARPPSTTRSEMGQ